MEMKRLTQYQGGLQGMPETPVHPLNSRNLTRPVTDSRRDLAGVALVMAVLIGWSFAFWLHPCATTAATVIAVVLAVAVVRVAALLKVRRRARHIRDLHARAAAFSASRGAH
jgi:hypothetical protein